jgi:hypothetical protein
MAEGKDNGMIGGPMSLFKTKSPIIMKDEKNYIALSEKTT